MAQPIKYIGRTTDFRGKTIWEIVGNLKDYGIGRIIIRNMFQRYKEPCYMRILKVEGQPTPIEPLKDRYVGVWVERVFRGVRTPYPVDMSNVSYKTDYRLIPKHEEAKYTNQPLKDLDTVKNLKLIPPTMDFPPVMHRLIAKESGNPHPKLTVILNKSKENFYRIAVEDETPTIEFSSFMSLGKPVSPNLYKGVGLNFDKENSKQ